MGLHELNRGKYIAFNGAVTMRISASRTLRVAALDSGVRHRQRAGNDVRLKVLQSPVRREPTD
jgi:hypothetical protein